MSSSIGKGENSAPYHMCVRNSIPIGVRDSKIQGADKGLFIAGDIAAAQEVFRVLEPMVTAVHSHAIETTCDNCFLNVASILDIQSGHFMIKNGRRVRNDAKLLTCNKCKCTRYCSIECQRIAWSSHHKYECSSDLGQEIAQLTHITQRALIRLLLKCKAGKVTKEHMGTVVGAKTLSAEFAMEDCSSATKSEALMAKKLAKSDMPTADVLRLYLRLMVALKAITNPPYHTAGGRLGVVLDLYSTFINHSCDPNMFMISEGTSIRYRSIQKISKMEGLTISYVPVACDVLARRDMLMREYVFICKCEWSGRLS